MLLQTASYLTYEYSSSFQETPGLVPRKLTTHSVQLNSNKHALRSSSSILCTLDAQPPLTRLQDPIPALSTHAVQPPATISPPPFPRRIQRQPGHCRRLIDRTTWQPVLVPVIPSRLHHPRPWIRRAIQRHGRIGLYHAFDPILTQRRVPRRGRLARRAPARHQQPQRRRRWRQVQLACNDLKQFSDARACVPEELDTQARVPRRVEVQPHVLAADLEDELGGRGVDIGAGVIDPPGRGVASVRCRGGWGGGRRQHRDAGFQDVLEAQGDFVLAARLVEG